VENLMEILEGRSFIFREPLYLVEALGREDDVFSAESVK